MALPRRQRRIAVLGLGYCSFERYLRGRGDFLILGKSSDLLRAHVPVGSCRLRKDTGIATVQTCLLRRRKLCCGGCLLYGQLGLHGYDVRHSNERPEESLRRASEGQNG